VAPRHCSDRQTDDGRLFLAHSGRLVVTAGASHGSGFVTFTHCVKKTELIETRSPSLAWKRMNRKPQLSRLEVFPVAFSPDCSRNRGRITVSMLTGEAVCNFIQEMVVRLGIATGRRRTGPVR